MTQSYVRNHNIKKTNCGINIVNMTVSILEYSLFQNNNFPVLPFSLFLPYTYYLAAFTRNVFSPQAMLSRVCVSVLLWVSWYVTQWLQVCLYCSTFQCQHLSVPASHWISKSLCERVLETQSTQWKYAWNKCVFVQYMNMKMRLEWGDNRIRIGLEL